MLLQRVSDAKVLIRGETAASIGPGLLVFVGIQPSDDEPRAAKLIGRVLNYRIFGDDDGRMNRSLLQIGADLLLVPQFTLAADTRHGLRPGFSTAAPPAHARKLFDAVVSAARAQHTAVRTGVFGADMQISLTNDGPVTFWIEG